MKTIGDIYEDQFRVTSIPFASSDVVIFTGIPLQKNSYKTNNGKYYVTIKANPENIPVLPAIGQHWSVKGTVILPFLTAVKSRGYAAINGGLPPLALCGRS